MPQLTTPTTVGIRPSSDDLESWTIWGGEKAPLKMLVACCWMIWPKRTDWREAAPERKSNQTKHYNLGLVSLKLNNLFTLNLLSLFSSKLCVLGPEKSRQIFNSWTDGFLGLGIFFFLNHFFNLIADQNIVIFGKRKKRDERSAAISLASIIFALSISLKIDETAEMQFGKKLC